MKIWQLTTLLSASLVLLSGCNGLKPSVEEKKVIDKTLPVISLTQNGVIVDMTAVAFEWKSLTDSRISSIGVYRHVPADGNASELHYYETLNSRFKTHYVDSDVAPGQEYKYAFKVYTSENEGQMSKVYNVKTKPVLQSVSWIHSITGLPRSAKIIWRPHTNQRVEKYIIERRTLDQEEFEELDTVSGRLNAEYIDDELKDNYTYMYRIRAKTYDGLISTPSDIVKVITKPLPKSVMHITATKELPKKIKIDWKAQKPKDFDRFYLYRSKEVDGDYELIAKLYNPTFEDNLKEDGARYFYRVSVVDKDGLESEYDKVSVIGMSLAKPQAPAVFKAQLTADGVELSWTNVDPRSKSFQLEREQKKGWFDVKSKVIKNINKTRYLDKNIEPDSTYRYIVYGVDDNGIVSQPSLEAVVVTPESNEIILPKKAESIESHSVTKPVKSSEIIAPADDLEVNEL